MRSVAYSVVLIAGLLGGCGTDGGGSVFSGGSGEQQSLTPHAGTLTSDEAYHLLRRAAFGATPEEVNRAVQRGLDATLDDLLRIRTVPSEVSALAAQYEDSVQKQWMVHLLEGPNPLHERMVLFWHDRFATSARVIDDGRDRGIEFTHWEMLRNNALGNYRQFLEALTIDPLMLVWLDGANSPKHNPNENYTREFWELFTLGRDTVYDEADIREGARAFTGITLLRDWDEPTRPIYDLLFHDETDKTIFPIRAADANHDYLSVIDLTLAQPEAAAYVARNLFACFVHDHPSDAVVAELAREFVADDFEIAPLVRRILASRAFFAPEARGNQITSPVEHIVGVARTLDMHLYSEESQGWPFDQLLHGLRDAGQQLLDPPGVQGWGENDAWLRDQWLISRIEALGRTFEFGPNRTEGLPYHLLPPMDTWQQRESRSAIVEVVANVFHLELTDAEKDIYIEVLDQNGWRALHLVEPDDQPRHVGEMIRLMAMHEGVIGR